MQNAESMLNLTVLWRGKKYIVGMNSDASLKELGDELQKVTDVKADTMRFIAPQFSNKSSKLLFPFSDEHARVTLREASLDEERAIRMMGVSEDEVDKVLQDAKIDMRIAGFDEEEKRTKQLMSSRSPSLLKLPPGPYIFCGFRTLQLPGIELNPPASEALKRMHMLAADPGIVAIMNKHRWRVGIMTEMAPVGYVGVSPKCILGFNKNHGEEISLRLRTDDLKGFRKYKSIKKTLLHELAHMVYSEHDANFFALDRQLNEEAISLDWTKSTGHTLSGIRNPGHYDKEYYISDDGTTSQKLGGDAANQLPSARATSVAAAYRRLVDLSANSTGVSDDHVESDPEDSSFTLHDDPYVSDYIGGANNCVEHMDVVRHKLDSEPDHDGLSCDHNKYEPNPDDCRGSPAKLMEILNGRIQPSKTFDERDPDDLDIEHKFVGEGNIERPDQNESIVTESHEVQAHKNEAYREPDPDDLEVEHKSVGDGIIERPNQDDSVVTESDVQALKNEARREPDPDELPANRSVLTNPDVDVVVVPSQVISSMQIDEPDPDDQELQRIQDSATVVCSRLQKAIAILRSEVSPHEATAAVQTLFKIIRNVIEHPDEMKFKRLRKSNPTIQKNVANHQAAMEILRLVGFGEDVVFNEIGREENYLVLKRKDPGLLWLAKSSLESLVH